MNQQTEEKEKQLEFPSPKGRHTKLVSGSEPASDLLQQKIKIAQEAQAEKYGILPETLRDIIDTFGVDSPEIFKLLRKGLSLEDAVKLVTKR